MNRRDAMTGFLAAAWMGAAQAQPDFDVPFVTTPQNVVDAMLDLAEVGPADVLMDLGSGDGRIVLTAARRWGTRGIGIEIDPYLVLRANESAREQGLADRVRFEVADLFLADLSAATVITMYLLPDVNLRLKPRLRALRPGTRIVSHDWDLGDWAPERVIEVEAPDKRVGRRKTSGLMRWTV